MKFFARCIPFVCLPLALGACSYEPAHVSAAESALLAAMDYPAPAKYGEDLPVIVTRENGLSTRFIRLNHTGTENKHDCVLWLDRQYAGEVPLLRVGTENLVDLTACINRHGEPFPVGRFFRRDLNKRVVLVELYDPKTNLRHRLIARPPVDKYAP